jgi:hypothetical protein
MKKINYRSVAAISATILVLTLSCKKSNLGISSLYTPTTTDVTSSATLEELQQGRTLYINNCGSCHGLYSPDDYSSTQWKSIMSSMGPKTAMSASDKVLVTKYVSRGK